MALDEAMLLSTGQDNGARFRFYTWSTPTISLGYFQDYEQFLSTFPDLVKLDIVRRLTGGGAILHDIEITYCLAIPSGNPLYTEGPITAYRLIHQSIADVLARFGISLQLRPEKTRNSTIKKEPEFCFARPCPTDLICPEGKLVGSAQRRLPTAFMQHGSIILENRFPIQPTASLSYLLTQPIDLADLENQIAEELGEKLRMNLHQREFNESELSLAENLTEKYQNPEWTIRRNSNSKYQIHNLNSH